MAILRPLGTTLSALQGSFQQATLRTVRRRLTFGRSWPLVRHSWLLWGRSGLFMVLSWPLLLLLIMMMTDDDGDNDG